MDRDARIEALEAATLPLLIAPRDEHVVVVARLIALITAGLAAGRFVLDASRHPRGTSQPTRRPVVHPAIEWAGGVSNGPDRAP